MKILKSLLCLLAVVLIAASCTNFGKKVKAGHIETYYKDGITEDQAQRTATLLYNLDINAGNTPSQKSFQLSKKDGAIFLKMVIADPGNAEVNDYNFMAIGDYISDSAFAGAPVNMDLTDNRFKTIRIIPYKKLTEEDLQKAK